MALSFEEQSFVRTILRRRLEEKHSNAFESFFHDIMCARYADFVDVRTHGNLGDIGADGLSLHGGKLYACYGPQTPDAGEVRRKFRGDLAKAIEKRGGHFTTFVFVHNDLGGVHPEVSLLLSQAVVDYPHVKFEQMGPRHLWQELCRLERHQLIDVLGCDIPVAERVYGIGLDDLAPLLDHLIQQRRAAGALAEVRTVPPEKLDYNELDEDDRAKIISVMRYTPLVEDYYRGRRDVTERDEVAQGFNAYYQEIRGSYDDPGDVLWQLHEYVGGNARGSRDQDRAVMVVLAYFFATCDIFEEPPPNWQAPEVEEAAR